MSTLQQKLSEKTDDELLYYISNVDKHTHEAVQLAHEELQKRKIELPENISSDMEEQLQLKANQTQGRHKSRWSRNVVTDQDAPELYSQRAIYIFSILLSVFFGSFLLAENCKLVGRKKWPVLLFGFVYTALSIVILTYFDIKSGGTIVFCITGAYILSDFFWNSYIGSDTKYRVKSVKKPTIIGLIISVPIIIAFIYTM